ncbi:MAG: Nif3-like dinuclear metal center hexameric protein [Ruminococcus sp.]|nr:Nif3-like dinuclear metal center hexameric protein [Ruminococcus sp.]
MLDNRLRKCAEYVSGNGIVCDIGTDHALLAVELINENRCGRVIASDINTGPLDSARKNVEKAGLSDKIELVLTDGMRSIPLEGVSDIVIAGMGGETIADILEACGDLRDGTYKPLLILQPMTKTAELRRRLYKMGFMIIDEAVVGEGGKLYTVILAEIGYGDELMTEYQSIRGLPVKLSKTARQLCEQEAARIEKVSAALDECGKYDDSVHAAALAAKLRHGIMGVPVGEIYSFLDTLFPFSTQDSWDNSGLLVDTGEEVRTVVLSLDITNEAVNEARCKSADLIISHHPVIFDPLRSVSCNDPVYELIQGGISALCLHTNADKSPYGTNGVILRRLRERFGITAEPEIFEDTGDGLGYGYICELPESLPAEYFGSELKSIFGCEVVRLSANHPDSVKRVAFCSGSGGSTLGLALDKGCDAYITGDVKHDVWITACNRGIALYDCGHFHTENPFVFELRRLLEEKFPQLDIEVAESSCDPCTYI